MKSIDVSGQKFGKLLPIKRFREKTKSGFVRTSYLCRCDCGAETIVDYGNLQTGGSKSCGCLRKEKLGRERRTYEASCLNKVGRAYRRNALLRKIDFELTDDQFRKIILSPCHYCDSEWSNEVRLKYDFRMRYNGIDRLDSQLGYVLENCVPCCKICNRAKGDLSVKDFLAWVVKIKGFQSGPIQF
jgi:hypothetical protein